MLKKFDDLTAEQQKLVYLMYSDKETVKHYLYNFDDKGKYVGRQFAPQVGILHAEAIEQIERFKKEADEVIIRTPAKKSRKK